MEFSFRYVPRGLCWDGAKASSLAQQGSAWRALQRIEQSEGVVKGNFATVLKIGMLSKTLGFRFSNNYVGIVWLPCKRLR